MKNKKQKNKIVNLIHTHISNNSKEYLIVTLIFIIGIFLGVLCINNMNETQNIEISTYYNSFIEKLKTTENINIFKLIKSSMSSNLILGVVLWFFGTTVIGIPVVFGVMLYRGFCFGYTISTVITINGIGKGLLQATSLLLLQNIIFIPAIIAISVSGFKLYKSIVKDKNKDNIKPEVLRHTIFSGLMLVMLSMSSLIEVFVSTNLFKMVIR